MDNIYLPCFYVLAHAHTLTVRVISPNTFSSFSNFKETVPENLMIWDILVLRVMRLKNGLVLDFGITN